MSNLSFLMMATGLCVATLFACSEPERPSHREIVELRGGPYERGLTHGKQLRSKIRAFHAQMLTNSLMPSLARERPAIAGILWAYQEDEYLDGQFGEKLLVENAYALEEFIPEHLKQEMQGVADGSNLTYEQILVLNTFFDSVLGVLALRSFLSYNAGPKIIEFEILDPVGNYPLAVDGLDNDGDGDIDEIDEGRIEAYEPSPHALFDQLPSDAIIRFRLEDADGVDPDELLVSLDGVEHDANSSAIGVEVLHVVAPEDEGDPIDPELPPNSLWVTFTPPGGLALGSKHALDIRAGDLKIISDPLPAHASFSRTEWITLATSGYPRPLAQIGNEGIKGPRLAASGIGLAMGGAMTSAGQEFLAHHFALLDNNTAHKHGVLFVHTEDDGRSFAYLGWAGLVWGTSGMNNRGLTYAMNPEGHGKSSS